MRTDLNAMTFGIEIECTIPVEKLTAAGWAVGGYHVGAEIPGHPGWKAMHDGSIRAAYPRAGVEVVSPVLRGVEGLEQVERMVATLRTLDAKVNRSTGFHVHIGWNGTPEQLRRLVCFVAFHEKALFASTGTRSREQNQYCSSIKLRLRALEHLQSEADIVRQGMSRYHVLNLTNLGRGLKRTVEFRVFAGTLNLIKILAYVQLCLGIVQKALDNPRQPLAWDAPASERQARLRQGDGVWAMRRLLTHLHWRQTPRPGRASAGVLRPTQTADLIAQLLKLARQYDERGGTTGGTR